MSGHSHFKQIKHKKEASDQKRGELFSKLLNAITVAAKEEANPDFNPRLRTTVDKAKQNNVPQENIERAIKKASEAGQNLEEFTAEAFGPAGAAIIIETITDNKNRTIMEIKKILNENEGKWAGSGSVLWAFDPPTGRQNGQWKAKFPQEIGREDKEKLRNLIRILEEQEETQEVITNIKGLL